MKALHPRHQAIFDFINTHVSAHGSRPTYKEIADALGFRSTNTVWVAVSRMELKGLPLLGARPKQESDPDLLALAQCVRALNGCSEAGRIANVGYLVSRFTKQAETMGK